MTGPEPKRGKTPGSGRKKGSKNKRTKQLEEILAKHDFEPAEKLVRCFNDAYKIFQMRARRKNFVGAISALKVAGDFAAELAQFKYPKYRSIEHSGPDGKPIAMTFTDFVSSLEDSGEE